MTSVISSSTSRRPLTLVLNVVRGALIGAAELIPGVSGGTVALVTGVYDRLIDSAAHLIAAARRLVTGPDRRSSAQELRQTDWWLVVPILLAMAAVVLAAAGLMESFVTDHAEHARGLFFGLVAVSIIVPTKMLPKGRVHRIRDIVLVVLAAVVAYVLIGAAGGGVVTDPPLIMVFGAAAVAVCALVIPGVSGSFFLLSVGLYSTTLGAVDDRNLDYLAVFGAGIVFGLALFVPVLRRLLTNYRRVTLLVMIGLMIGSLRALWPWQSEGGESGVGELIAPQDPLWGPILLALAGAALVIGLILLESRIAVESD